MRLPETLIFVVLFLADKAGTWTWTWTSQSLYRREHGLIAKQHLPRSDSSRIRPSADAWPQPPANERSGQQSAGTRGQEGPECEVHTILYVLCS
uniref:Secreted protein n=1 Tax=Steinernema glaseri TaxID=37863 RepID=A0A1I7YDA3_9BILA